MTCLLLRQTNLLKPDRVLREITDKIFLIKKTDDEGQAFETIV